MTLDIGEEKASKIKNDVYQNMENIVSEEDAKMQIINRLINEALGWPITDFRAENKHDNGFSDYILMDNDKPAFLVEAKRIGKLEIQVAEKSKSHKLKISGSSLKKRCQVLIKLQVIH